MTLISRAASERLFAAGYRNETLPFGGTRAFRDFVGAGVYATLEVDPEMNSFRWGVWSWEGGIPVAGGHSSDPEAAADYADTWVREQWT